MIHDLPQGFFRNEYLPVPPEAADYVFFFRGNTVLARDGGTLDFPRVRDVDGAQVKYLFRAGDASCFLGDGDPDLPGFSWQSVRIFRDHLPRTAAFSLITAYHLAGWYGRTRFCGACGGHMAPDGKERMMRCPACGNTVYPVISPAVIVGITKGERLLLTRYRGRPVTSQALVAGFCEIGESLEATVRREVKEETGLTVDRITYYKSQPWGLSSSLLAGFFADVPGDDTVTVQEDELSEAIWVDRTAIDVPDDGISLTREMIELFRNGKEPAFPY